MFGMGLVGLALLLPASSSHAIRPFVTDDARVVGAGLAQVETWLFANRTEWIHNALFAVGPVDWLELTTGFLHGTSRSPRGDDWSHTGGLVQFKALLREALSDDWPGVAVAGGVIPVTGRGFLRPGGQGRFLFAALTQNIRDEALLIHANLGTAVERCQECSSNVTTGGLGFQGRVRGGFHVVGEFYRGDPYQPTRRGNAVQMGVRHIFSDQVQVDGTLGRAVSGPADTWLTIGIRLVSPRLW